MLELDQNEVLIKVFRKHIFHFLTQACGLIIVAILPLMAYPFTEAFLFPDSPAKLGYLSLFIYFMYLMVLWNIGFIMWTDYYLDMWILTDKRLIDVEQKGLFSREVSSLRLDRIQDIKLQVSGFVQTFVGMGSVYVQTAGSEKEFIIRNAKHPEQAKDLILAAHNKQMEATKTVRVETTNTPSIPS